MVEKIRCRGHYCEVCKKCISPPKLRLHFQKDWWTVCDECGPNVVRITFIPREEYVRTDFKVLLQDIPELIRILKRACKTDYIIKNEK